MKTTNEIVIETVNYYEPYPERRAVTAGSGCEYKTPDGRCCAVGRVLGKPLPWPGASVCVGNGDGPQQNADALEDCLKPEYRGHASGFWTALQLWHDTPSNWRKPLPDVPPMEREEFMAETAATRRRALTALWDAYCEGPMPTYESGRGFVDYPVTPDVKA